MQDPTPLSYETPPKPPPRSLTVVVIAALVSIGCLLIGTAMFSVRSVMSPLPATPGPAAPAPATQATGTPLPPPPTTP